MPILSCSTSQAKVSATAGTAVDVIKLNDTVADKVPNWTNLKITFQNPEPSTFKSGTTVKVSLYLDGDKDKATAISPVKILP